MSSDTDRIVADITSRIRTGELRPGQILPSYSRLAQEFGVSTATVQRAMLVLRARGLVVGRPGRDTYVAGAEPGGDQVS